MVSDRNASRSLDRLRTSSLMASVFIVLVALLHLPSAWAFSSVTTCSSRPSTRQSTLYMADATTASSPKESSKSVFGDWEELHGNFLLRPSPSQGPPRALLHFLGGAIVGAAPQVTYRYMLERLADQGYLVVATPFNLSFDHLATCDAVIERFERIAPMLVRFEYNMCIRSISKTNKHVCNDFIF